MTADRLYSAALTYGDSLIQFSTQAQRLIFYYRCHKGLPREIIDYLNIFCPGQWWTYRNVREQAECLVCAR